METRADHPISEATGFSLERTEGEDGESVVLSLSGEVDLSSAEAFHEQFHRLVDSLNGHVGLVNLDLHECTFIDSTAIRTLIELSREQRAQGRALGLSRIAAAPLRILEIAGLIDSGEFSVGPGPPPRD
jgi:anti-anti-sigma factor